MNQAYTDSAVLDLVVVIEMYGDSSRATLLHALQGFAQAAPPYIQHIIHAGETQDYAALASAAHSLKSIAALSGAMQLYELSRQLELAARDTDLISLKLLLTALSPCWQQLQQQLAAELLRLR